MNVSLQNVLTFVSFVCRFLLNSIPNKLKQFVQDLHSGKLHREFHFGPDPVTNEGNQIDGGTQPPESTFRKLAPSSSRYTLLRDEL